MKLAKIAVLSSLMFSFNALAKPMIELYKSPTCGCCKEWAEIMESKGYEVHVNETQDWTSVKQQFGMPAQLQSCHTAIIDGYLIEGHVPESDIKRLLEERPENISGIAAPGMPQHSPGMARPGQEYKDFNVVSFDKIGQMKLYNKY
ncbi:DUF411 domain-containing protein [uncultured Vibrio sp.]|uniref:DUF411 domain-containing protein n=1 Tax=uncultured Vibrio sp. TaxID=114054 RepID=UPI00260D84F1|nr:DUF411 domain-containing protein [uncultured Vibrio sp.]